MVLRQNEWTKIVPGINAVKENSHMTTLVPCSRRDTKFFTDEERTLEVKSRFVLCNETPSTILTTFNRGFLSATNLEHTFVSSEYQ